MGGVDKHRPSTETGLTPVLPHLTSMRRISSKQLSRKSVAGDHRRRIESVKPEPRNEALEALKVALTDDPSTRSDAALSLIYEWMKKHCTNTNIFASSHEYVCREICRHMRLIKLPSHAMLIRQGDTGDRCYIIIDGTLDVFIRQDAAFQGFSDQAETMYRLAPASLNVGKFMTALTPGSIVGEVVLTNPSVRRTATVVVSKDTAECCVIFLGRVDYIRLIRNVSMEASHFVQAEILDFMVLFQKWPKPEKMKYVAQMKSVHFRANDYLYKSGTTTKVMYIIVLGEALEKYNLNAVHTSGGQVATKSEVKINIELLLLGPGEIANEFAFFKPSMVGHFDIKAVTDVHALAIDKHLYEAMMTPTEYAQDLQAKLTSMSNDRDDWRKERIEFGSRYPDAHIAMTWNLMRMGNLRCSRCGRRGHLPSDLGRCHHSKKNDWPSVQQRLEKQLNPPPPQRTTRTSDSPRVKRRSIHSNIMARDLHRDTLDESSLPTAKEQLAVSWRLRLLVFPKHVEATAQEEPPTAPHTT
ncbi:hypothetical protein SDRG_13200 [Saprolegnia diclina VS20]|uniref:Cyclic nucleotide-binding domain-containing protein n=2 Tax=Saprolegnia diclina (strain VS20) TaxID=1156394 RepID=T0PU63_SAPDV|nr:hypothetical protein SDRG_13200 [Saprolegnia diclina VS20]EQC29044.1 hypothetical protein SDRG_13200 [Saprolegnia diclina VS20]|eukprot:XP_008617503.1 hypothetical protein SDRG_13200 [Saprolegnia diclina VS20]